MRGLFSLFLVVGLVAGCSSDSDGKNSAVGKCEQFASTWCTHSMDCLVQVNRLSQSEEPDQLDACKRVAVAAVPCDKAVDVGASFDQCIADVDAMPCQTWDVELTQLSAIKPPNTCSGVIKVTK